MKDKQGIVRSLWTAVNEGGEWLKEVPNVVRAVITTRAWEEREVDGRIVRHKRFIDFVTTKPRAGCGWPPEKVEALIKGHPDVEELWRKAITPEVGANQHTLSKDHYNMMTRQGTSRAYTLDRLKRERPDLFRCVCDGVRRLSPRPSSMIACRPHGARGKPALCLAR
jgi:hypothetical protein